MTFPPARTMFSLTALDHADGGKYTPDGRVFASIGDKLWQVLGSEIDELTARGWLNQLPPRDENTAVLVVTDAGRYWLTRWAKKHRGRLSVLASMELSILVSAQ